MPKDKMKLLIASKNPDKIAEIKYLLDDCDIEILSKNEVDFPETIEDRDTIKGNAIKKAKGAALETGFPTLADDTGFFVEALKGDPGVYSARYAGEDCSYKDNRDKILKNMKNINKRKAEFRTIAVFADSNGVIKISKGVVKGKVTKKEIGSNGFGYDSIFRADETGLTFGEMSNEQKNQISHRARALKVIIPVIRNYYQKMED